MEQTSAPITLPSSITVKKLGELLDVPVTTLITELMKNGNLATINEEVDFETASVIASDLGFETTLSDEETSEGVITLEAMNITVDASEPTLLSGVTIFTL